MATARPPGNVPRASIGFDYSALRNAPQTARQIGQATARELSQAFRALQNEQRLAITQAQQTLAVVRAQQTQISATTRAESSIRVITARTEAQAQQQAARVAANAAIEEQRRVTAALRAEQRQRRQFSAGGFAGGVGGAALGSLGGPVGAIAGAAAGGAVPAAVGLALVEAGRYAVEVSRVATAYNRQNVAAVQLAGSQAQLNQLLQVYDRVTGGAIARTTALSDVTRLMAVGFGDTSQELEQFVRAARGISVATGQQQDYVISQLQLAIANQSTLRLDQLGLGVSEVKNRIDQLRASNKGLTTEMAYQQAVLGLAEEKFGALVDSAEGQATGAERAGKAWSDLGLEIGQLTQTPVDFFFTLIASRLQDQINLMHAWQRGFRGMRVAMGMSPELPRFDAPGVASGGGFARNAAERAANLEPDQVAALRRREEGFAAINRAETRSRLETTRQYETQRSRTISQFEQSRAEEAEDFARKRLNDERRFNLSLLDVARDSARQRARWQADLEREIEEARADRDERIAEAREASGERIAEIEARFNRDSEKRQRDFAKEMRDAAANLDAVRVRELQTQQREEDREAARARDEAVSDERESLRERIDEANESMAEQEADQRDALQRRIDLQAEEDALRLQEMTRQFAEQRAQEDIERGIQLQRQARNHEAQLAEMDLQRDDRIRQIKEQAQAERDQFTEESNAFLEAVGIHNQAWLDEQERINNGVIRRHEELLAAERRALLTRPDYSNAYAGRPLPPGAVGSGDFAMPVAPISSSISNSRSSSVVIQPGAINVVAPPDMALDERAAAWFMGILAQFFEDYPQ